MKWDRWKQILAIIISFVILLTLPLLGEIYYKTPYYIIIILLIPVAIHKFIWNKKYEQKFYEKWHKAREQGFKINVAREGAKGFTLMIVLVLIDQFLGRGLTPFDIVYKLPSGILIWLLVLLMAFSLAIGVAAWYGNEKRYCRIYFESKNQQEIDDDS